jgi:hypothetical protein
LVSAEERLKILTMIAEGKISAEEGVQLLAALKRSERQGQAPDARQMRVRVTNSETGHVKVNMSLPISLVQVGMRMGARFVPDLEIEFDDVIAAINKGTRGKIVDLEDEVDGERIEIFVE